MIVGVLTLTFRLHGNRSLKGKRQVAAGLKQKLRNRFNVAVSEVAAQDRLDKLVLGLATVAPDTVGAESRLQKALMHAQEATSEELVDSSLEIFAAEDEADNGF